MSGPAHGSPSTDKAPEAAFCRHGPCPRSGALLKGHVLQQLRRKHTCGLLVVTGRADTHDRVMGLELGADDYVVKPFEPRELIARVRSILRRYPGQPELPADPAKRVAEFAGWRFAPGSNTLTSPAGQEETLSTAEAQLLSVLLAHPNHILTREQLLGGRDVSALDRSIDLRVSRLRRRFCQAWHGLPKAQKCVVIVALLAVIVAVTNFIVDIIAALIDPRVRY